MQKDPTWVFHLQTKSDMQTKFTGREKPNLNSLRRLQVITHIRPC